MSIVYAVRCDGCGAVTSTLPPTWSGALTDMEHFCNSKPCQEKAKLRESAHTLWELYAGEKPLEARMPQ